MTSARRSTWAHGRVLCRDVFVDRPQGLLVLLRVWDWGSGGSTGSIGYLDAPPRRPHFVAETQRPSACDSSGRGGRILRRSDQPVAVVGNVIILEPDRAAIVAKSQRAGSL